MNNFHRKSDIALVVQDCNRRQKNPPNSQINLASLTAFHRELSDLAQALSTKHYTSFAELFRQNVPMNARAIDSYSFEKALMSLNCITVNQSVIKSIY